MILLSALIAEFSGALHAQYSHRLLPGHQRALAALQQCRTEHSPVLVVRCAACGQCETLPHSCGHRNCPHCQHHEGQQWLERQRAKLLPVDYFMVTFTLPAQLRALAWQYQRLVYDLLLKLGWQTLSDFGLNDPVYRARSVRTRCSTPIRGGWTFTRMSISSFRRVPWIRNTGCGGVRTGLGSSMKATWPRSSVPSGFKHSRTKA